MEKTILDIIGIIIAILSFVVACVAIYYTRCSLREQKKQWLNDAFIKHEAEILLKFKTLYNESQESIDWFLHTLLHPAQYGFHLNETLTLKREDIIKHHNKINFLNNFYNENQSLFRKHNLEKKLECLAIFIKLISFFPKRDLSYKLVSNVYEKEGDIEKYLLENWGELVPQFVLYSYEVFKGDFEKVFAVQNYEPEFVNMRDRVALELNSLSFDLEKLTMFNEDFSNLSLNARKMYFAQDLEA